MDQGMVLAVSEWQWVVNQGVSFAVLAFVGLLLWRVLVGSKGNGYQGLLIKWANGMSDRMLKHAEEQTEFGSAVKAEHKVIDDALTLLVESERPPIGAAFMAASAVHKTAADVAALRHAALQCM